MWKSYIFLGIFLVVTVVSLSFAKENKNSMSDDVLIKFFSEYKNCSSTKVHSVHGKYKLVCPKISASPVIFAYFRSVVSFNLKDNKPKVTYYFSINCHSSTITVNLLSFTTHLKDTIIHHSKMNNELSVNSCKLEDIEKQIGLNSKDHKISKLTLNYVSNINEDHLNLIDPQHIEVQNIDLNKKLHYFNSLRNCREISLHCNSLGSLDGMNNTYLSILRSTGNPIENLSPETFENLTNLNTIQLLETNINKLWSNTFANTKARTIHIESDNLTSIETKTFLLETLHEVKIINQVKNIPVLPKHLFGHTIRSLSLSIGLKQISNESFGEKSKLEELNLSGNYLKEIPSNLFDIFPNLIKLNLSNNHLNDSTLFLKILDKKNINLDLSYNNLTFLDKNILHKLAFKNYSTRIQINISNNPWECNNEFLGINTNLRAIIVNVDELECYSEYRNSEIFHMKNHTLFVVIFLILIGGLGLIMLTVYCKFKKIKIWFNSRRRFFNEPGFVYRFDNNTNTE